MNAVEFQGQTIAPSKVVCVGRNFVDHISELGNEVPDSMVIFCKPNSSISDRLRLTRDEPLHYEGEICFLVEQGCLSAVGFGLDLTKRGLQSELKAKGLPWERAKSFDGSSLFSAFVPLPDDLDQLHVRLRINDTTVQHGNVQQMIHPPGSILAEIATFMSLHDGDIVMTGTPKGVGQLQLKDRLIGEILVGTETLVSGEWLVE